MLGVAPASVHSILSLFSLPNSIFLFGTRNREQITEVSVKEENEVILDRQTGVICIIEFLQKGKDTQLTEQL
jgi:hypothetical protein